MSVYRPKDRTGKEAEVYKFDFVHAGRRYSGSTGATTEREALRVEKAERAKAADEAKLIEQAKGALWTWEKASLTYIAEHLNNHVNGAVKSWALWLEDNIGANTPIRDIDTAFIQRLMMKKQATAKGVRGGQVTNSTLNRQVLEPIRRVFRHANEVHDQPLGKVAWKKLRRREPKVRVRELRGGEEADLFEHVRPDWLPLFYFCMISGFRIHEAAKLRWSDIDYAGRVIHVLGKGNKPATVPFVAAVREVVETQRGNHEEFVFTWVSQRTVRNYRQLGVNYEKGKRYPINHKTAKNAFILFRDRAQLHDFRLHDLRHTALSRIVRATKDLQAAQKIARHESITTTMRYAHILDEDVATAMQAGAQLALTKGVVGPETKSPTKIPTTAKNPRKKTDSAAA